MLDGFAMPRCHMSAARYADDEEPCHYFRLDAAER